MTIRARELQADRVGDLEGEVDDRRVGLGGEEALADADGELDLGTRLPAGRVGGEVGGAMGVDCASLSLDAAVQRAWAKWLRIGTRVKTQDQDPRPQPTPGFPPTPTPQTQYG